MHRAAIADVDGLANIAHAHPIERAVGVRTVRLATSGMSFDATSFGVLNSVPCGREAELRGELFTPTTPVLPP